MSGYIAPRIKAFAHLDRLAAWQAGVSPAPVTVEWDLSNTCSLRCGASGEGGGCHFAHTHVAGPWAGQAERPTNYADTGRFADIEVVFRGLSEMADCGVQAIVWSGGGEPTLHPDWSSALQYGRVCGLKQGMYTLGGHLAPETARIMAMTLDWVVVSLDAADADSYAAEKGVPPGRFVNAVRGIELLTAHPDLVVGVSFLLHAGNWQQTDEMLALARSLKATYATFRPSVSYDRDRADTCSDDRTWITAALPRLQQLQHEPDVEIDPARFVEYRDWTSHGYATCYGIRMLTQVTPDGRVWVCPNRRGIAGSSIGDLSKESFAAIWKRHPRQWTVQSDCRVMCRLHLLNVTLDQVFTPRKHEAFV